ncbi:hypothetical protein ACFPQ6_17885, partial [Deinococcus petrolearius]
MSERSDQILKASGLPEPSLAVLERADALFVLTASTLLYHDESGTRRVTLRDLARIHSDQEGTLRVETPAGTALSAGLVGFDPAEVQTFFRQVRDVTAQAKQLPATPAAGTPPAPAPTPAPRPQPAPLAPPAAPALVTPPAAPAPVTPPAPGAAPQPAPSPAPQGSAVIVGATSAAARRPAGTGQPGQNPASQKEPARKEAALKEAAQNPAAQSAAGQRPAAQRPAAPRTAPPPPPPLPVP